MIELKLLNVICPDTRTFLSVIRNRRYKRMQELISEGVYFSDEEMKERDQKLHYQMIGKLVLPSVITNSLTS